MRLLTKNLIEQAEGVYCKLISPENLMDIRHDHDFYEIFVTQEYPIKHWINGRKEEVAEYSAVLIHPADQHYYPKGQSGGILNIAITEALFEQTAACLSVEQKIMANENCCIQLDGQFVGWLTAWCLAGAPDDEEMRRIRQRGAIALLLTQLFSNNKWETLSAPSWVHELHQQFAAPEMFRLGVKHFYALSPKTKEHTARTFRKYYGEKPSDFIRRLRIAHARRLFETTDLSVLEVALEIGYESLSSFYAQFLQETGASPGKYRTAVQKKI